MQIRLVLNTDLVPVTKPVRLALLPRGIVVETDTGYHKGETWGCWWEHGLKSQNLKTVDMVPTGLNSGQI